MDVLRLMWSGVLYCLSVVDMFGVQLWAGVSKMYGAVWSQMSALLGGLTALFAYVSEMLAVPTLATWLSELGTRCMDLRRFVPDLGVMPVWLGELCGGMYQVYVRGVQLCTQVVSPFMNVGYQMWHKLTALFGAMYQGFAQVGSRYYICSIMVAIV